MTSVCALEDSTLLQLLHTNKSVQMDGILKLLSVTSSLNFQYVIASEKTTLIM